MNVVTPQRRRAPQLAADDPSRVRQRRVRCLLGIGGAVGILIPAAMIASIVLGHSENTVSNDYVRHIVGIDAMLGGHYDVRHYFRDTFLVGSHCTAIPFLFHLLNIWLFSWSLAVNLGTGIVFAVVRAVLLVAIAGIGWRERGWRQPWHWLLGLPAAMLVFSTPQISDFFGREASLTGNLTLLGALLAIYALARREPGNRALALACAGGILASWSSGAGPFVWPMIALGMVLRGWRSWKHYAGAVVAGCVAIIPYALYVDPDASAAARAGERNLLPVDYMVRAIGWPLVNDLDPHRALTYGIIGLVLAVAGLALWATGRIRLGWTRGDGRIAAAAMMFAFWAAGTWSIGAFRGGLPEDSTAPLGLAPWYAGFFMPFWSAVILLAWTLVTRQRVARPEGDDHAAAVEAQLQRVTTGWAALTALMLFGLLLSADRTWRDKGPGLSGRTPATVSCLRMYEQAPAMCEHMVFPWGLRAENNLPLLGRGLERHDLSVFAQRQTWLLQGDWMLDDVQIDAGRPRWVGQTFWTGERRLTPWDRLDLQLTRGTEIRWLPPLPRKLDSATLYVGARSSHASGGARAVVVVAGRTHVLRPGTDLSIAITSQTRPLPITISSTGSIRLTPPRIELDVADSASTSPAYATSPPIVRWIERLDFDSDSTQAINMWPDTKPADAAAGVTSWRTGRAGRFEQTFDEPLCTTSATQFRYSMRVRAKGVEPHATSLMLRLAGHPTYAGGAGALIPIVADGAWHDYHLSLRTLSSDGSPWDACIDRVWFSPLVNGKRGRRIPIDLRDVGFATATER